VALTRTALLSQEESTDYVDSWCELLRLDGAQRAALALYTAAFCIGFMGEVGHPFNRSDTITVDERRAERLVAVLEEQLKES
jgi:hypothetical protein